MLLAAHAHQGHNTCDICTVHCQCIWTLHLQCTLKSQLRAFAKYTLKGDQGALEGADPDWKGYTSTLPQSAVEPPMQFLVSENTDDSNKVLEQALLMFMYILNALIALLLGAFLLQSLFKIYK